MRVQLDILELADVQSAWRKILSGESHTPGIDWSHLWLERLLSLYSTTTSSGLGPRRIA